LPLVLFAPIWGLMIGIVPMCFINFT